jgi:dual specificity tyrosine-phosphorylation-regulated kinase 2/3/4
MQNNTSRADNVKISLKSPEMSTSPSTNTDLPTKSGKSSTDSTISLNFVTSPKQNLSQISSFSSLNNSSFDRKISKEPHLFPKPCRYRKPPIKSGFLTPTRALLDYFDVLTEAEQNEIIYYEEIYYVGLNCKKNPSPFDDPDGYYVAVQGDHLEFRYEIKEALGSGTFGQVFNCFDYKRHINVAVKIIRNKPIHRKAGDLEKKILHELSKADPNDTNCIVKKLRSFEFRGHLCLVFELLSVNLYDFLSRNNFQGLSIALVRRAAVQLFMALKTVHSVGIIHCDLKPENILLKFENKSSIKVIDFGSACQEGNKVFDYIQSRYYRAPEVVFEAGYDKPIDIWSVGCILFELVTGCPLFPAQSESELFKMITETLGIPPKEFLLKGKRRHYYINPDGGLKRKAEVGTRPLRFMLEGFDEGLIDLIENCIKWDPSTRIDAEQGLAHPWVRGFKDRINR